MSPAQPIGLAGGKIVLAHRGRQADSKPLSGRTDPLLRRPIAGKHSLREFGDSLLVPRDALARPVRNREVTVRESERLRQYRVGPILPLEPARRIGGTPQM